MPRIAFIYPIIRLDYIQKSVETLQKFTKDFTLIVVDQTIEGLPKEWIDKNVNLYLRFKNHGFAKAANEGMIHAFRWKIPYIAVVNDDTEFIYDGWLDDALKEFKTDPKIIAINPESPRVPLWGYGRPHDEYIDLVEYKESYTPQDIAFLKQGDYLEELKKRYEVEPKELPDGADGKKDWSGKIHIPINRQGDFTPHGAFVNKRGVIDGFAGWLPIFKWESLNEIGFYDERFVWGGGEDYDMMARAYSCAWPNHTDQCDEAKHYRMVSTMKSWVWHWWGKSKDVKSELDQRLFENDKPWNDLEFLYPPDINYGYHVDPWGHLTHPGTGQRKGFKRIMDVAVKPL